MRVKHKTEAQLLLEEMLGVLFGGFHSEQHIQQPDYLAPWRKVKKLMPWRVDYFVERHRLCVELEGGIWLGRGHTGGKIYQQNLDKYNHISVLGYRMLRFSTDDVRKGKARAILNAWKAAHIGSQAQEMPSTEAP